MPEQTIFIKSLMVAAHQHLRLNGSAELSHGMNLLVGKNGSGKTTILQMIRGIAFGEGQQAFTELDRPELPDIVARLTLYRGADGDAAIERNKAANVFIGREYLDQKVRFVTSNRGLQNELNVRGLMSGLSTFELPDPGETINVGDEFNKAINSELIERLRLIDGGLDDVTKDIEAAYRAGLVDLDKDIRLDFERDNPVYFVDHLEREVLITQLSAGEKEFLYFFAYLRRIRNDVGRIILIDEPELHLHGTQVRKLCEMLSELALNNQVIVATHSSDVLHHFLQAANIVLLRKGSMQNVEFPHEMRDLISQLGMPIDPSVFTAHWIVAENDETSTLKGADAPNTADVLEWLFGKSIHRRFWAFGSSRVSAAQGIELLSRATANPGNITLSAILDGDRRITSAAEWPAAKHGDDDALYLPVWELENLFLVPSLIDAVGSHVGVEDLRTKFWRRVVAEADRVATSALKTLTKNLVRRTQSENRIGTNPPEDLVALQQAFAAIDVSAADVMNVVHEKIASKDWRWLPGKELLGILVDECPGFWTGVRSIPDADLAGHFTTDSEIAALVEAVHAAEGV